MGTGTKQSKITGDIRGYEEGMVTGAFVCNLIVGIVLLVKQFSWLGLLGLLVANALLIVVFTFEEYDQFPVGIQGISFFMADIIQLLFMNSKAVKEAMTFLVHQEGYKELFYFRNFPVILFGIGVILFLSSGKPFSILFYGGVLSYLVFGYDQELKQSAGFRFFVLYAAVSVVFWILHSLTMELSMLDQELVGTKKKQLTLWRLGYALAALLLAVYIRCDTTRLDWDSLQGMFRRFYSLWILIPVPLLLLTMVFDSLKRHKRYSPKMESDSDASKSKKLWFPIFDAFSVTGCMLIYLFIGMAFRHYTTLNLLLLLWFIRSFRKKMEQSILSKNALTEYVRLILRFLNMIIMILLLENGLLVNIIITLFLERSLKKKWNRKLNVLDVSPEQLLLGQRNLYAVWKSKVNERSTWLWLTLGIALECAGWLCTKRSAFLDGTGRLLCAGLPQAEYFFCLLMMLVMACLVYYILFYKNPMGLHSTSWEAGLVCLLFLIGCLTLMQTGGTDIAASKTEWGMQVKIANQIRKGEGQQVQSGYGYLLTGTRSENLTQRITNRMTAIPLSSKGYTGYEYWDLFPKQIDARTESYLIESVDTNGTATFAVFWYPALLEAFFNGSLQ